MALQDTARTYARTLIPVLRRVSQSFPVLLLTGPRQVGKTTALEMCADADRQYVTLDDLDVRSLAQNDPGLFIQTYTAPLIIDEVQYAPQLFSYIKIAVDRAKKNGLFWLTGSQKFHLMDGITESLAGRVAILDLLGLSQSEIDGRGLLSQPFLPTPAWISTAQENQAPFPKPLALITLYERIWRGAFPRVCINDIAERDIFYRSYIQSYIQRDVQDILHISDATIFYRFLSAIAARTSQMLNYADLARDVGVNNKTVHAWISVLEKSGLIYLLQPYYTNLTKRLTKTPKLYFLDTGLCTYLTKWPNVASLESGAMSGAILETYVFSEIVKSYWHNGLSACFYYYRDFDQKEVDLLIESGDTIYPVEYKKTATPSRTASKNFGVLDKLGKIIGPGAVLCCVEKAIPLSQRVTAIPISYL